MRYKRIRSIIMAGVLGMLNVLFAYSQPADSLGYYLELAARNNPQINADFSLYKASLEKVPQAGAYPDPELEIGFFLKPMEILSGKQIADFTLMQMFPWFGTRKAARNEATEMARMAYEQFRNSRNNLYYEVKSQWYQLCNISEQYKNTQANLRLLDQLEQLALNRFSAPSAKAGGSSVLPSPVSSAPSTPPAVSGGGMSGMGGSSMGSPTVQSTGASGSTMSGMSGDSPMGGGSMGSGNSIGGMSDVLRIQMEKVELENTLASFPVPLTPMITLTIIITPSLSAGNASGLCLYVTISAGGLQPVCTSSLKIHMEIFVRSGGFSIGLCRSGRQAHACAHIPPNGTLQSALGITAASPARPCAPQNRACPGGRTYSFYRPPRRAGRRG